jgi:hypothetical protein
LHKKTRLVAVGGNSLSEDDESPIVGAEGPARALCVGDLLLRLCQRGLHAIDLALKLGRLISLRTQDHEPERDQQANHGYRKKNGLLVSLHGVVPVPGMNVSTASRP